ncbi:acetylornithine deacetylase/succinyl-diaminopimelate desuccinylase family protein [Azospirillum brasilense]|uniref:Acetylornithine deacetylase/succinyl-diaminopimelate desuccinylase family protein n=1 Tax=Azospirillum brasilense TaxID=192 RepID=A0A0P0EIZ4_AZOBR|nr:MULTISPECIES: acetylornithine deacetylase/succinyl-diaminopimelate desuccinylase family protein [Azospirillum]ALJ37929.1 succinyl-diaminopimelate desuccinylase [Azospirillum brasilense]MDW7556632.1 acetylornithine deacetylase/succinyl-diaminopimelate desuccinylase family protein [Azospirillum brasilense]MDW7596400.1 acetylornithine deacetylase/succinyl-diaminopimelate desuccinylase family protein [Azospirillum brasilense]MDW7631290.1 acetylornithine deacetylase/succinyl-diaminopimelate desuc
MPLDHRESLFRRIAERRDDLVALTRDLIRIPTVNPPGDVYTDCAEFLGRRLAGRGFAVEYVRADGAPGDSDRYPRTNVIARIEGREPGPCVHFNGHIDVVPAGQGWTVDPFEGVVKDGRVYGRGACDMKGGIAASVIAVEAILEAGIPFPGALEISSTVDEESGGYGGVGHLAKLGYFSRPRVDHVIIPEPLNVDRVCIGHRGVWWAEIETKGRVAHGSMPFLGNCAVRHMGAVLHRIETELIPRLAAKRTAMPVVPEGARQSTLNINAIHGGQPEDHGGLPSPMVPDRCRMVIDRRYLIEEDPEEVRAEIVGILEDLRRERPGFEYELREVLAFLPTLTDADAPVVRAVGAAIETVLGRPAAQVVSPGTYDQKHIARVGHLKDCIAYGPGILDLAHQPDEYVGIDDMVHSAQVMAMAALSLLRREV